MEGATLNALDDCGVVRVRHPFTGFCTLCVLGYATTRSVTVMRGEQPRLDFRLTDDGKRLARAIAKETPRV